MASGSHFSLVNVREGVPADAEAACAVLRRSIIECCAEDHRNEEKILSAWLANKTPGHLRDWFSSGGFPVVAVQGVVVVGVAMLSPGGVITLNYLVPEARFQGIGRTMLEVLEREAARQGQGVVTLASTATAHRFYQANGYADTGKVSSMFGLTSPLMTKTLPVASGPGG